VGGGCVLCAAEIRLLPPCFFFLHPFHHERRPSLSHRIATLPKKTQHPEPFGQVSEFSQSFGMLSRCGRYLRRALCRKEQNHNTIVPAPLGIKPTIIKYSRQTRPTTNRRPPRTVSQPTNIFATTDTGFKPTAVPGSRTLTNLRLMALPEKNKTTTPLYQRH